MAGLVLRVDVTQFNEKMKAAQKAAQDVTLSTKETARLFKIVPKDAAKLGSSISSSMLTAQHDINGLNASLHSLHSLLQRAIPAIGVEEAIRRSITAYADYQTALTNMGKLTDQSFGEIDRQIKSLNPALGSYTELVEGYYQVISAGVTDATKALELLETASQAAKAAGVSQGDTIRALTSLMTGYAGQLKNSADAADVLFTIERYGKTSVQELAPYIGELSSVSRIAGVNVDSLGASLSVITQTAGSTATASTQVKALFLELTKESDSLKKVLSDMGKDTFQQLLAENGGDAVKALQEVEAQARKTGTSFSTLFGSQEAQIAAKNLIDLSSEYQKALQGIQERTGAMTKAFGTYTETLNGLFATTRNLASDLAVHIGEAFGGTAAQGLASLNEAINFLTDNFNTVKSVSAALIASLATLAVVYKTNESGIISKTKATLADIAATKEQAIAQQQLRIEVLKTELEAFKSDSAIRYGQNLKRASAGVREAIITDIRMMEEEILVAERAATRLNTKSKALMAASGAGSKAFKGFGKSASKVISFMGGPWVAAFTIATGAVAYLSTRQKESESIAERYRDVNTQVSKSLKEQAKQAGEAEKNIKNLSATQAKLAQEQAKRDQQSSLTELAFMANANPWESYLNTDGKVNDVDKIRGVISNFIQDVKNGKADIGATAKEINLLGSTSEEAAKFAQGVLTVLNNYDAATITIESTTNVVKNLTDNLDQASNAAQGTKESLLSISGIDEALKQSELISFTNRLPNEMRSVASFLKSSFKELKPEQIEKVLKGNFEGFSSDDANKLQQIINNLKTPKFKSTNGTSEIDNAKEKIKQLKEEIDRLNGTDVKANTDLSQTIREIESVGAKAKLSGDEIKKIKEDYEAAFTTSTLKEFNKELLQAQGNTQELRAIEVADAINEWTQRLEALGLTEDEVTAKTKQLREAMNLQSQIKDAEAAANFYKEMAELSGNYGRSQEYVNKLLALQADNLIRTVGIPRELANEWLELQKIQNNREAWAGAYRATRQYFSEATNLASNFESLTTNAFSNMEDAMVDFAMTGKASFSDMVNSMVADLIRLTVRANITGPLADALGSGIKGLFSVGSWMPSSAAQAAASTSGYAGMGFRYSGGSALGNVFSGGDLSLYRNSVVTRPTFFTHDEHIRKYATGAGLMGEAGPEAIMPLTRMSGGELGVKAEGVNTTPQVNIQVINQTGTSATAEVQQQRNAQGGVDVVVMLKREMASDIARGGVLDQTIRGRYGVKPIVRGR